MNKLKRFVYGGAPYHGLATNGTLTHAYAGTLSVSYDGGTNADLIGPCVYVKNPTAPGLIRNTAQAAKDSAESMEWRDYALLTGVNRAFTGSPDAELGPFRWLYADPTGNTWRLNLAYAKDTDTITFEVHLDAIFGRFGVPRAFSSSLLASLVWSPDIPSWYTPGYTASDIVTAVNLDFNYTLAIAEDGSEVYVHIWCADATINAAVFKETTAQVAGHNTARALIGVLKITLTGSGDLDASGSGITATLVENLAYEGGIVTGRTASSAATPPSTITCDYIQITATTDWPEFPGIDCTDTIFTTFDQVFSFSYTGATSGSSAGDELAFSAILYRTPDGDVVRDFDLISGRQNWTFSACGSYTKTWHIANCAVSPYTYTTPAESGGWYYDPAATTYAGNAIAGRLAVTEVNRHYEKITVCGTVSVESNLYQETLTYFIDGPCADGGIGSGLVVCSGYAIGDAGVQSDTSTYNGASTPNTNFWLVPMECRQLAQNLMYVARYHSIPADEANQSMDEFHIGIDYQGTPSIVWSDSYTSTDRSGTYGDFPIARELVASYQPRTGAHAHATWNYASVYSGTTYQYV